MLNIHKAHSRICNNEKDCHPAAWEVFQEGVKEKTERDWKQFTVWVGEVNKKGGRRLKMVIDIPEQDQQCKRG